MSHGSGLCELDCALDCESERMLCEKGRRPSGKAADPRKSGVDDRTKDCVLDIAVIDNMKKIKIPAFNKRNCSCVQFLVGYASFFDNPILYSCRFNQKKLSKFSFQLTFPYLFIFYTHWN